MKQIVHIFKKDARRFRLEVAASLAIVCWFTWTEVRNWSDADRYRGGILGFERTLPTILLLLSWWLLVTRAVQDESLVGDRQFWITRPYRWKQLLAAKVLFVILFINLPLMLADVFLLEKAGFRSFLFVRGLLWMQVMIGGYLLLPIGALATVTPSLAQMGLASLIVGAYFGGVAYLSNFVPSSSFSFDSDILQPVLLIATCTAVVVWQYARRRTAKSRFLLAAVGALDVVLLVLIPYGALVAKNYPELSTDQKAPVRVESIPPEPHGSDERDRFSIGDDVSVNFPVKLSGLANDSIVEVNGLMLTIDPDGALARNSGWESRGMSLFPDENGTELSFELPQTYFEQIKTTPVKVRISLILTEYHKADKRTFVVPSGKFDLPGVGRCLAKKGLTESLSCQLPMKRPPSLLLATELATSTCPVGPDDSSKVSGHTGYWVQMNSDAETVEFGFSPIQSFDVYISPEGTYPNFRGICPGTPLTLSDLNAGRRFRISLQIDDARLDDYRFRFGRFVIGNR